MEISEKLKRENGTEIFLYKEGVFWVAYEQSAYAVWLQRKYKPSRKYIKAVQREVVSLGFPEKAKEGLYLQPETLVDESEFQAWRSQIELTEQTVSPKTGEVAGQVFHSAVEAKIKDFDLSNATPMDCMSFIFELKKNFHSSFSAFR